MDIPTSPNQSLDIKRECPDLDTIDIKDADTRTHLTRLKHSRISAIDIKKEPPENLLNECPNSSDFNLEMSHTKMEPELDLFDDRLANYPQSSVS